LIIFAKDNSITQKVLGRNRIKYLTSLKIKKFRDADGQFLIEGDKIVRDALKNSGVVINQLIATGTWINENQPVTGKNLKEIVEAEISEISRFSTFETPPPVIALLDIQKYQPDFHEVAESLSLGLDNIQDPGNLGTIIRTADWYGIRNIFCTEGSADFLNPKVVQASMGAVLNVKVHYVDFHDFLKSLLDLSDYTLLGTYMQGTPLNDSEKTNRGIIIFGNESRGISDDYAPYIKDKITIPSRNNTENHVESLNVASSVAIVLETMCK
jgi:TrmH family RNA methyltransferase